MSFGGGGFGSASPFGGASTTNNAFGGFGSNSNTPGTFLDSLILYSHRVVCVCVCAVPNRLVPYQQAVLAPTTTTPTPPPVLVPRVQQEEAFSAVELRVSAVAQVGCTPSNPPSYLENRDRPYPWLIY